MKKIITSCVILLISLFSITSFGQNGVMLQGFYWDVPVDGQNKNGFWYDSLSSKMTELKQAGFTEIWMPPPSKGNWGIYDMGYGVHDHYDLGKYEQISTTETRFGSYRELTRLIEIAHDTNNGPRINLLADILLNHIYSTQLKDFEVNPVLKEYIFNEAKVDGKDNYPYPINEIIWQLPAKSSSISFVLKCFSSQSFKNWNGALFIEIDTSISSLYNQQRKMPLPIKADNSVEVVGFYSTQIENAMDGEEFFIANSSGKEIFIRISARQKNGDNWEWTDQAKGVYIKNVFENKKDYTDEINILTTTGVNYVEKPGLPDLQWNYAHFHPGFEGDFLNGELIDDRVTPNLKWFGHDFNHSNPEVLKNLSEWGKWLRDSIGYDGFRFDFVMGVEQKFVADWINTVWNEHQQQATMVAEYFSKNKQRVYEWHSFISNATHNTKTKVFDFPLKFELTKMCNSDDYDMRKLLFAGMLFDSVYKLPSTDLISFVDNHDTGKESDKWVTRDWELAYAYVLFAPSEPCVFYNHFFGDKQIEFYHDKKELEIPNNLKKDIFRLMQIRQQYLSGTMQHISNETIDYKNLYIASRSGDNNKTAAFLTINNSSENIESPEIKLGKEYELLYGKKLVNKLAPHNMAQISSKGKVSFMTNARSAGIWIVKEQ